VRKTRASRPALLRATVACVLVACNEVAPTQVSKRLLPLPTTVSASLATIGGEEYYGDEGSGELVPTSVRSARIVEPTSSVTMSCELQG
jgi:hypothetical protein